MAEVKNPRPLPLPRSREGRSLTPAKDFSLHPRAFRQRILAGSFVLFVVIPSLLGAFYFAFLASDRYVASAGFAVRGMDASASTDILSSFTGIAGSGSTLSDSYILLNFLESRDLVEKLEQTLPFREIYSTPNADFFSRLDPTLKIEHVVEYWEKSIDTSFDNISGIITFEVEAFTPEDAERLAKAVLGFSMDLVNELSAQARRDTVAYAKGEVAHAEGQLKAAQDALRAFRVAEKVLDPAGAARIQMELIGELEKQLSEINARREALKGVVVDDSPTMRGLVRQAQALEQQISRQKEEAGTNGQGKQGKSLTELLAAYEPLEVEREFAERAYASALTSFETARAEAGRQQRYLAVFSVPALPQYPLFPRRLLNIFLIFVGLGFLWGIGALTVYSVRDHIQ